jgi:hypothetical protein
LGSQPVAAVEANERAAVRLEEDGNASVVLDLPAEAAAGAALRRRRIGGASRRETPAAAAPKNGTKA